MFFSQILTSAIIHNDTSISLSVTNNYYDDRMIAHTHVLDLVYIAMAIYTRSTYKIQQLWLK